MQSETGLYDYGASFFGPEIARWMVVDPMVSKFPSYSPYVFCLDNPINLTDPDGREPQGLGSKCWRELKIFANRIGEFFKGIDKYIHRCSKITTRGNLLNENKNTGEEGMGAEVNAARHTLWQATITNKFGTNIGTEAGNAHEDNHNAIDGISTTILKTMIFKIIKESS